MAPCLTDPCSVFVGSVSTAAASGNVTNHCPSPVICNMNPSAERSDRVLKDKCFKIWTRDAKGRVKTKGWRQKAKLKMRVLRKSKVDSWREG